MTRTALVFLLGSLALLTDAPEPEVKWHRDLDAANEIARETGRPLLIVFR